jgi:hypothetical protein
MADLHCFECTQARFIAHDLMDNILAGSADKRMLFLPAPRTWIEWRYEGGIRHAFLLEETKNTAMYRTTWVTDDFSSTSGFLDRREVALIGAASPKISSNLQELDEARRMDAYLYAMLAIINTPRVVGRQTHAPHRGLQRELLRQRTTLGHFPLLAWTEIKLEIRPPRDASSKTPTEGYLTGRRALHFVRAHLRIVDGRLVKVSSHWRGDAALGIKQSRYVLQQPRH